MNLGPIGGLLTRKKAVARPHEITVERFVSEGWRTNIDNGVCDVMVWDRNHGWLRVTDVSPKRHPFVRKAFAVSFSNLEYSLDFYPDFRNTKLQVVYRDVAPFKPKTIPEEVPDIFGVHYSTR